MTMPRLTRREARVVEQILNGLTYKEIAQNMRCSERTAKWYVEKLYRKFGIVVRSGPKRGELLAKLGRFRVVWEYFAVAALLLCASPVRARAQTWDNPSALAWDSHAALAWDGPGALAWTPAYLCIWGIPTQHSAALSWTASTTPAATYNVYAGQVSGGPYLPLASGIPGVSWTDGTVQSGSTYYFVVTAFDGMTESVYSNEAQAVIP